MSLIRWIIALPIIVGTVLFAVANPDAVSIHWNPFEPPMTLPLYLVVLVFLAAGFLLGTIITWLSMGKLRSKCREQKKTIREQEKHINETNEKLIAALTRPDTKNLAVLPNNQINRDDDDDEPY